MADILHISGSPKHERSVSIEVADAFLRAYIANHPEDRVRTLNVFDTALPEFGAIESLAKFAPIEGRPQTAEERAAWERVERDPPDLLIVDLYLPVLGGIELIERVRATEATATTRIIAMSASFSDAKDRSLGAGADQFLQKPLRLVDVLDALTSQLRQYF